MTDSNRCKAFHTEKHVETNIQHERDPCLIKCVNIVILSNVRAFNFGFKCSELWYDVFFRESGKVDSRKKFQFIFLHLKTLTHPRYTCTILVLSLPEWHFQAVSFFFFNFCYLFPSNKYSATGFYSACL